MNSPADLPLAPLMRRDATPDDKAVWWACYALQRLEEDDRWDVSAAAVEAFDEEDWAEVAFRVGIATITASQRAAIISAVRDTEREQAAVDEARMVTR